MYQFINRQNGILLRRFLNLAPRKPEDPHSV